MDQIQEEIVQESVTLQETVRTDIFINEHIVPAGTIVEEICNTH